MGKDLPAIHGPDHLPWGPDPIPGLPFLYVTDGSVFVNPATELFIDHGLTLVDGGGGNAKISIGDYVAYSPVITCTQTDGGDPLADPDPAFFSTAGLYLKLNQFVHCIGTVNFGATPDTGNGQWNVSLPTGMESLNLHGRAFMNSGSAGPSPLQKMSFDAETELDATFRLTYPATWPMGDYTTFGWGGTHFGNPGGWTLSNTDNLSWNLTYRTTD